MEVSLLQIERAFQRAQDSGGLSLGRRGMEISEQGLWQLQEAETCGVCW